MTSKNINIKVLTAIILATLVVVAGVMLMNANQCFAKQVYQDAEAKATVNDNGISGTIELTDGSMFVTQSDNKSDRIGKVLRSIGGTQLKDIVKFNDGGDVDRFWVTHHITWDTQGAKFGAASVRKCSVIHVSGHGPEGFFSGSGHLKYYDDKGNTYTESLWRHAYSEHCEIVNDIDRAIKITKIDWWS